MWTNIDEAPRNGEVIIEMIKQAADITMPRLRALEKCLEEENNKQKNNTKHL